MYEIDLLLNGEKYKILLSVNYKKVMMNIKFTYLLNDIG